MKSVLNLFWSDTLILTKWFSKGPGDVHDKLVPHIAMQCNILKYPIRGLPKSTNLKSRLTLGEYAVIWIKKALFKNHQIRKTYNKSKIEIDSKKLEYP